MTPEQFQAQTNVSRETLNRLTIYANELVRWNRAINLVAPGSLKHLWQRHILDSWQLLQFAGQSRGRWLDLGSGGGLPGLIAAACVSRPMVLVESDQRKSVFLRETARKMGVDVTVDAARIESLADMTADTITARALASLPKLLELAAPFCHPGTVLILPKGQDVEAELTEATKYWTFDLEKHQSQSDSRGTILVIGDLKRHDGTR